MRNHHEMANTKTPSLPFVSVIVHKHKKVTFELHMRSVLKSNMAYVASYNPYFQLIGVFPWYQQDKNLHTSKSFVMSMCGTLLIQISSLFTASLLQIADGKAFKKYSVLVFFKILHGPIFKMPHVKILNFTTKPIYHLCSSIDRFDIFLTTPKKHCNVRK